MTTHRLTVELVRSEREMTITVYGSEPPGLNALLRMHWRARKRRQEDLALMLRSRGTLTYFFGPVTIEYFRSYSRVPMDTDNLNGSFKLIGDALVDLGVIEDDKPSILHLVPTQGQRGKLGPHFRLRITPREA